MRLLWNAVASLAPTLSSLPAILVFQVYRRFGKRQRARGNAFGRRRDCLRVPPREQRRIENENDRAPSLGFLRTARARRPADWLRAAFLRRVHAQARVGRA